jgi:hypothetical protein
MRCIAPTVIFVDHPRGATRLGVFSLRTGCRLFSRFGVSLELGFWSLVLHFMNKVGCGLGRQDSGCARFTPESPSPRWPRPRR